MSRSASTSAASSLGAPTRRVPKQHSQIRPKVTWDAARAQASTRACDKARGTRPVSAAPSPTQKPVASKRHARARSLSLSLSSSSSDLLRRGVSLSLSLSLFLCEGKRVLCRARASLKACARWPAPRRSRACSQLARDQVRWTELCETHSSRHGSQATFSTPLGNARFHLPRSAKRVVCAEEQLANSLHDHRGFPRTRRPTRVRTVCSLPLRLFVSCSVRRDLARKRTRPARARR